MKISKAEVIGVLSAVIGIGGLIIDNLQGAEDERQKTELINEMESVRKRLADLEAPEKDRRRVD